LQWVAQKQLERHNAEVLILIHRAPVCELLVVQPLGDEAGKDERARAILKEENPLLSKFSQNNGLFACCCCRPSYSRISRISSLNTTSIDSGFCER
jgi:hypothetical protein